MRVRSLLRTTAMAILAALALIFPAPPAPAQGPANVQVAPDLCLALALAPFHPNPRWAGVSSLMTRVQLKTGETRISFIGHATFLIESQSGVRIATDYNDYVRPAVIPDIATMNRAHSTHYTNAPDPGIRHVLRGWNAGGGAAQHDLTLADVRVRNVPTNIRTYEGGTDMWGNSIFVFETGGLCIGHLGHLHHTLTSQQLAQIGQLDVVLVPVDGSFTLDVAGMLEVLMALKAPLMIPMHYFSAATLERFLSQAQPHFEVEQSPVATTVVSRARLPRRPTILVLPGG